MTVYIDSPQVQRESPADAANRSATHHPIPDELKRIPRWMGTVLEPCPGKPGEVNKPPYRVRRGQPIIKAAKIEPENWATFSEAVAAYECGDVNAIGIVLTEDDPYFGLDMDRVLDSETGEIHPAAHQIIHALGTYTEVSCSGRGLRAIGIGTKPAGAGCKCSALGFGVEVYDRARFLVMTGNVLPGSSERVEVRQRELDALCRKLWPKERRKPARKPEKGAHSSLDDAELLDRARSARTGAKFRALYDQGDVSGYPSESEADYALLNMLSFWTAGDHDRIVRLFEASALYRPDGKHRGYVELSARNALESYTGRFYRPRRIKSMAPSAKEDALAPYLRLLLDPSAWRGQRGASAYKAFAAAVSLAAERGIDADDELRLGCDMRTLSEVAGLRRQTLTDSALPYLVTEKKLLRWRRGKGKQAGQLVLTAQGVSDRANKITTRTYFNFIGTNQHTPDATLETLRLLIRMRGGRSKRAYLARLGMVAMFALVALCAAPARGYSVEQLGEATGRRKPDLRRVMRRLKSAEIVREVRTDFYRLTENFAAEYERELRESGIVESERRQRYRHEQERERRDEKLTNAGERSDAKLKGRDAYRRGNKPDPAPTTREMDERRWSRLKTSGRIPELERESEHFPDVYVDRGDPQVPLGERYAERKVRRMVRVGPGPQEKPKLPALSADGVYHHAPMCGCWLCKEAG